MKIDSVLLKSVYPFVIYVLNCDKYEQQMDGFR